MQMNLNHLALFHAVADTGSMTMAAERLGISQPAVSKQVKEFEKALGVGLFDRLGRGIRLTQAGELLAEYARRVFALVREGERAVADLVGLDRGRLTVGASTTIGSYLLPPVLAAFAERHPDVELLVEIANTEEVHRRLLARTLDVALTEGFVEGEELDGEVFGVDELVLVACPTHPLARRRQVKVADLEGEPFVLREPGSGTRAVEEQALARFGLKVDVAMSLGSTEGIKRVVASGLGMAIVSRLSVAGELSAATLVVVPVAGMRIDRPLHLVRQRGRRDGPALKAFCAVLREEFPPRQ
jgi:DNA-binding transcriptional LysR family regulator